MKLYTLNILPKRKRQTINKTNVHSVSFQSILDLFAPITFSLKPWTNQKRHKQNQDKMISTQPAYSTWSQFMLASKRFTLWLHFIELKYWSAIEFMFESVNSTHLHARNLPILPSILYIDV